MKKLSLIECSRDAMQGWPNLIPTEKKIAYINSLIEVGFDTIDFGSFVSAKAIPQLADTDKVLKGLRLDNTTTKLLAIVGNVRGAAEAVQHEKISYIGFPFSISATFQKLNTNSTMEESLQRVDKIQELCKLHQKILVVYLSMGFGNPYGDPYSAEVLLQWADKMIDREVTIISLADTVGLASPDQIQFALHTLNLTYPKTTFGVHLHVTQGNWDAKLEAALNSGCIRFDGALKGFGGCPMAQNDLVGNMDTELMIGYFQQKNMIKGLNKAALERSLELASQIFV